MPISSESVRHEPQAEQPRTGILFGVTLLSAMLVLFVCASVIFGSYGVSRRSVSPAPSVVPVHTAEELETALRARGAHGAALVVATERLGYAPISIETSAPVLAWPVKRIDLRRYYADRIARDTWVWVLARTDVARTVTYLLPAETLASLVAQGRERGFPGIAANDRSILANDEGYLRRIAGTLGSQPPARVLVVDASYFENATAATLVDELRRGSFRAPLVIAYAAEDDPELSDHARDEFERAVPLLQEFVGGGRP